jgi:hypothetical protein
MQRSPLDPLARCDQPRPSDPDLLCGAVLASLDGQRLTVRCRSCRAAHVFVVADGAIVPLGEPRGVRVALHCTEP